MKTILRPLAAAEILLIAPAALFIAALMVRSFQPNQYEPAHTAARIVALYASSTRIGLWLLMMALPFIVLVAGCMALAAAWRADAALRQAAHQVLAAVRAHLALLFIACATSAAFVTLAIVWLHVATD
jgi:hypothetical protein